MIKNELLTTRPDVALVPIDVERDAPKGVEWLAGAAGRGTLRLMGVTDANNHESTLEDERKRLRSIIANPNEDAWMIRFEDTIVGILELELEDKEYIAAPVISIMIGDESTRRKGVGVASIQAALDYLQQSGYRQAHARHLCNNVASASLLMKAGFVNEGEAYRDADGLEWQNMQRQLAEEQNH